MKRPPVISLEIRLNLFPVTQTVKNPPVMQESWVWSLGREDPLEKGSATHSVFWPGEFHGQRSLASYSPWGRTESDTTEGLTLLDHCYHPCGEKDHRDKTAFPQLWTRCISPFTVLFFKCPQWCFVVCNVQVLDFLLDRVPCVLFIDFWSNVLPSP